MTVACFLYRAVYTRYLCPGECIISDPGGEFKNEVMTILSTSFDVDFRMTSPGNPKSNGLAEANVKTIKNKIKALMSETCNLHFLYDLNICA